MSESPFDYVSAINEKDKSKVEARGMSGYVPYLTNRSLGNFRETVLLANEMNVNHHLDPALQFHFLFAAVPRGRRFAKWGKPEDDKCIDAIMRWEGISRPKAIQYAAMMNDNMKEAIVREVEKANASTGKKRVE